MYQKRRQFRNASQPREAASSMKFFVNIDCLGTVMWNKQKYLKFKCLKPRRVRIFGHIKNGLRTKFECLKVILSWWIENMLGVLLLFKISRNLIEFKPFKKSCELIFSLIRIVFLKKSSNFNYMSFGCCMQIRYTHKLSMHKADFCQNREVCTTF